MRAIVMDRFEDCGKARIAELPTPEPKSGEVLIQVAAAGVNPVDWKEAEGHEKDFTTYEFPFVLGYDGAGRVVRLGAGVTDIQVGDAVLVFSDRFRGHNGTFAEYLCAATDLVADMPKTIDYPQAASIPCAAMTGYQCLFRADKGNLKADDKVLIHGATGGIGSFTVQFAKQAGLAVAATCGNNNAAYAKGLGADIVIDSRAGDIGDQVRKWAPEGVSAIVDCVSMGTLSLAQAFRAMKRGGRLISIATLTHDGDIEGDTKEAERNGFIKIWSIMNFDNLREQYRALATLIDTGQVKMPPVSIFPMENAGQVLRQVREGHVVGKCVLQVADLPR